MTGLVVLSILLLPYSNFPFVQMGSLKPLAAVILVPTAVFLVARGAVVSRSIRLRPGDVAFGLVLASIVLVSLLHLAVGVPDSTKPQSALQRYAELLLFVGITWASFVVGRWAASRIAPARFARLVLLAYMPSLLVGFLQVLTHNGHATQAIRHILTSGDYPVGYYRIAMLTTEPSWAAFDLCAIVIPVSIAVLFSARGWLERSAMWLLLAGELGLVIATKSALGIVLLISLASFVFLARPSRGTVAVGVTAILVALVVLGGSVALTKQTPYLVARYDRLASSVFSGAAWEESAATRLVSYQVGVRAFLEHPLLGVGFRNEGFYYSSLVPASDLRYPLIRNWANPLSARFADVKAFPLAVMSGGGLAVLLPCLWLSTIIGLAILRASRSRLLLGLAASLVVAFIGSLSIDILGLPAPWLVLGYVLVVVDRRETQTERLDSPRP